MASAGDIAGIYCVGKGCGQANAALRQNKPFLIMTLESSVLLNYALVIPTWKCFLLYNKDVQHQGDWSILDYPGLECLVFMNCDSAVHTTEKRISLKKW